ncbi:MAG: ethanolamine ammonia-lyase subunit EutC [Dehalococcoidia bacterium]
MSDKRYATDEPTIDLPDPTTAEARRRSGVGQPATPSALHDLIAATSARIGVGRAGSRPPTQALLRFQADHAVTQDALYREVDPAQVETWGLLSVRSAVSGGRREYLLRPDLGRRLGDAAGHFLQERCIAAPELQIVVGDGLSAEAIETNLGDLLPALIERAAIAGLQTGTPVFVKDARVGVINEFGDLLRPEVIVLLIGERPGLGRAEALSAYLAYRPRSGQTDADRNVISGIFAGGIPPRQAAAAIVDLAHTMIEHQASGVRLKRALASGQS